jgi:hypothetical protein
MGWFDHPPNVRSDIGHDREGVTYDALMRWEWEGGAPASVSDPGEVVRAEARGEHPNRPPRNGCRRSVES